jgi:hypothetical protein
MGGLYFSHRYHEADRRIDERRLLVESSERVLLEVERRIEARIDAVRAVGVSLVSVDGDQTGRIGLPVGVEAVWVGRRRLGIDGLQWMGASSERGSFLAQGPGLTPEQLAGIGGPGDRVSLQVLPEKDGHAPDFKRPFWFAMPSVQERADSERRLVLAKVTPEFFLLASQDGFAHRDSMSRVEFRLVPAGVENTSTGLKDGLRKGRSVHKLLKIAPFLGFEAGLRGDAVWRTRLELEKNGLWLLLGALVLFYIGELALSRWRPPAQVSRGHGAGSDIGLNSEAGAGVPGTQRGSRFPSRATSGLSQAPRDGNRERTVTREIKAGAEVFGGMADTLATKIERKEVAVLHGRLVEPDLWTAEGKVSPQEVADSVFEMLGGVREALQTEGLHPEIRLFEEGAFTIFFEVWGEGQGGFAAPLMAVLAIRKVVARINGLRNTDGHRSVRIMMGLRTGVLVRDSRTLPVRYHGITLREAQDLARAAGLLGVDCLIAPMGDDSRGEPLLQLAGDFVLKPNALGVFPADAAGKQVSLYVVEGTRGVDEQGRSHESPVISGATFDQVPEAGAKTAARELKLEYLQVAALEPAPDNVSPRRSAALPNTAAASGAAGMHLPAEWVTGECVECVG